MIKYSDKALLKVVKPMKFNERYIDNEQYCLNYKEMKDIYADISKLTEQINIKAKEYPQLSDLSLNKLMWFLTEEKDIEKRMVFFNSLLKSLDKNNGYYKFIEGNLAKAEILQRDFLPLAKKLYGRLQDFDIIKNVLNRIENEEIEENEME